MFNLLLLFLIIFPIAVNPFLPEQSYTTHKTIFLVLIISLWWTGVWFKRKNLLLQWDQVPRLPLFMALLFLSLIIISVLFSVDIQTSLSGKIARYEGLSTWICYLSLFVAVLWRSSVFMKYNWLVGFSFIATLASIQGILEHFNLSIINTGSTRSVSFFSSANFFGTFSLIAILVTMLLLFTANKKKFAALYLFLLAIQFLGLLYSTTRSAWLGLAMCLFITGVYILWKNRPLFKRYISVIFLFIILFCTANNLANNILANRAATIVQDTKTAITEDNMNAGSHRWYIWRTSLPLIKEYFWTGSGPDTFHLVFPNDSAETMKYFPTVTVDKAHNEWLQIAVTMGVPALISYLLLVGTILFKAYKTIIKSKNPSIELVMVTVLISSYLIQAQFNISVVPVAPYFWVFLALTYMYALRDEKEFKINSNMSINKNSSTF
ncbi:O-antigen ligase family protein [Bacillus litorisediminis]|uniref:O-antigen ligase family protein n=1 Tax=Bacillus litorisediminis TaxID=2922713 RepID=UPI001FAF2D10|nr:O-antigen ligase family protein [Bacillus litorisediminis]